MRILDEWETIRLLKETRGSISRYGDGEFKLCCGGHAKSQSPGANNVIRKRLCEILKSNLPNHVVGIPRIFEDRDDYCNEAKKQHWQKYSGSVYRQLLDKNKTYGSAFITRPDAVTGIYKPEFFTLVKSLWAGRRVVLLRGIHCGFDKDFTVFDCAINVFTLVGPDRDAFDSYDYLLRLTLNYSANDDVIVIALGPTATVLAYDLCAMGRQALDLGHFGMFYAGIHPKCEDIQNGSSTH